MSLRPSPDRPSFWAALWRPPASPPSALHRYTAANGLGYLGIGATLYAAPGLLLLAPGFPPFQGHEEGLVRALGLTVAIIGWFYLIGGRSQSTAFGLSTVVDRLLLPLLLAPLLLTGALPLPLGLPFALLDPLLGLGALALWARAR